MARLGLLPQITQWQQTRERKIRIGNSKAKRIKAVKEEGANSLEAAACEAKAPKVQVVTNRRIRAAKLGARAVPVGIKVLQSGSATCGSCASLD